MGAAAEKMDDGFNSTVQQMHDDATANAKGKEDGKGNAPEGGTSIGVPSPDDKRVLKIIQQAMEELDQLDQEATEINAKRKAIRERLEGKGINRHAFAYARQYANMKESKKEGLDLSYMLCRQASGCPVQTDWIED